MDSDFEWLVGMLVTVGGVAVVGFRNLADRISRGNGELHKRVDDVKEKYVRRDDFAIHSNRIETQMGELKDEMKEHNRAVLTAVADIGKHD